MTTLTLTTEVKGTAFTKLPKYSKLIKRGIALSLKQYGQMYQKSTRRRIAVGKTDPNGAAWAPWAFSTLQSRIRKGNAARGLLYDTGDLWRSIQYRVKGNVLYLGSTVEYAEHLQKGTYKMPRREIVNFNTRRTKKEVSKLLAKNLGFK